MSDSAQNDSGICPTCGTHPAEMASLAARYRALTEHFPNGIIALYDHDLRYVMVHGARVEVGRGPADLVGRRLRDVFPPEVYERDEPALLAALNGQSTESIVAYGPQWFRVLTIPVRDGEGRVVQGMVMSQNITRLKQTELDLAAAVERLSLAVRTAGLGIWEVDLDTGGMSWSPALRAIYGFDATGPEVTTRVWRRMLHPDDREVALGAVQQIASGLKVDAVEFRIVRPDGDVRHIRAAAARFEPTRRDAAHRVVGVNQDITALRRGEARLRESEARYRSLFDHTSDAVLLADDAGAVVEANPATGTLLGEAAEALVGRQVFACVVDGDDETAFWSGLRRDGVRTATLELRRRDDERRYVAVSARADVQPGLHLLVVRDLTEQRRAAAEQSRLEAQNRQAQKLEAVGLLTGGVAHDFNNLLHVILAQTEEATFDLEPGHVAREPLGDVRAAAERARRVVAQLLAFARKQVLRPSRLSLDETVDSLVRMLEPLLGRHIRVDWQPSGDLPPVHADLSTVEQVVMNLCLNARDAMPDGGTLTLRTRALELQPAEARGLDVEPGSFVELTVRDDGIGMAAEVLPRVFDPFFTTKEQGTGMGLATVYGIVRQHGGAIWVDSAPRAGTTFNVLWPGATTEATDAPPTRDVAQAPPRETARILLAEDDPLVAKVTTRYLEQAGYAVRRVEDGAQAVEALRAHADEIDLALLDILMPVMTGPTAYGLMARQRADLPVVFMSGYADLSNAARRIVSERPLLRKPFARRALLDAVRDALASARAVPGAPPPPSPSRHSS